MFEKCVLNNIYPIFLKIFMMKNVTQSVIMWMCAKEMKFYSIVDQKILENWKKLHNIAEKLIAKKIIDFLWDKRMKALNS